MYRNYHLSITYIVGTVFWSQLWSSNFKKIESKIGEFQRQGEKQSAVQPLAHFPLENKKIRQSQVHEIMNYT